MLIKSSDEEAASAEGGLDRENLNIIRRIIDDFERDQDHGNHPHHHQQQQQKNPRARGRRFISGSDSLIARCRVSPKVQTFHHRSHDGRFASPKKKSWDSLYINVCETEASVENADANSPKNIRFQEARRQTRAAFLGVSKALDEAAAAAAERQKHQEKVMKGVQEVGGLC